MRSLDLPALTHVSGDLTVRALPRPRSADCARILARRAEPPLLLSWRVAMRVMAAQ